MEDLTEAMERIRKTLSAKETNSTNELLKSTEQKESQTRTYLSKCKHKACDGSGIVINEKGYAEFCECRADLILEKKLEFANIPEEFKELRVADFNLEHYSDKERAIADLARKAVVNYIKSYKEFKGKGKGLYLYSETKGSGKTRLAASLGNALISTYQERVRFITTLDLLDEIKGTYNKDSSLSENDLIGAIKEVDVLILDDIGVEGDTSWVQEKLYSILNGRMVSNKITIFTSNSRVEELKQDERIKNRLEKMAIPIKMPEQSIRTSLARDENKELQDILYN